MFEIESEDYLEFEDNIHDLCRKYWEKSPSATRFNEVATALDAQLFGTLCFFTKSRR